MAARADESMARAALDGWLVMRYRDAQLLEDTPGVAPSMMAGASYPRVESARPATTGDTLFAVHFGAVRGAAALRAGGTVRLSEASGAISSQSARLVVRRPFRAPAMPGSTLRPGARADKAGRYGWGYLLVVTRTARSSDVPPPPGAWRGWLLVEQPDTLPRRAESSRGAKKTDAAVRVDSVPPDSVPPG